MVADLYSELEQVEAKAALIRAQIRDGDCKNYGHDWSDTGGANAACDEWCSCSIPVRRCKKCGDLDYGDNDDAKQIVANCGLSFASEPKEK